MEMQKFNPSLELAEVTEPIFMPIKTYKELNSERGVSRLQRFVADYKLFGIQGTSLANFLLAWKREEVVEAATMLQEAL
eukprot:CAMPEP_0170495090 /NCGR_PEP_ID=MMETSP0208-20121228/15008_1 /TAXON_ID=197538 /ORGANISM="Strombidium inclinatum, Strain S3" /LENGTH=78 /DNA_ID=CAMNT_0010771231 /DNA_START=755 /DNA_END=991 /DNA_ORIENTATION=+